MEEPINNPSTAYYTERGTLLRDFRNALLTRPCRQQSHQPDPQCVRFL